MLAPGDKWQLTLSDADYESVNKKLRMADYPLNIKNIEIITSEVIFEDNTKWVAGRSHPRNQREHLKTPPNQSKQKSDSRKALGRVARADRPFGSMSTFSFVGASRTIPAEASAPAETDLPDCGNQSDAHRSLVIRATLTEFAVRLRHTL